LLLQNTTLKSTFLHSPMFEYACTFSSLQLCNACPEYSALINENILTNEKLRVSIDLLNATLLRQENNINVFTPYIPIIAVIIGSIAAYFFTRYHWSFSEKKKIEADHLGKISTLISDIEKISIGYWIEAHNKDDVENEIYIKSKIKLLAKYVKNIGKEQESKKNDLNDFASNLYDLVTGDDFESHNRMASKNKAGLIAFLCADILANISSHK